MTPDSQVRRLIDLTMGSNPITYGVVQPGADDPKGVLLVTGGSLIDGRIDLSSLRRISREIADQYRRTELRGGELLICIVGTPGEVAVAPAGLAGANISRSVALVRLGPEVDSQYVAYYLRSPVGRTQLLGNVVGSVQQHVNLKALKEVRIPIPSIVQQRNVSSTLRLLDDKIELNRRTNKTLEEICRALFKFWFVDFGPVRAKAAGRWKKGQSLPEMPADMWDLWPSEFEMSETGKIPIGWTLEPLSKIARFLNGLACQRFPVVDGEGLPVLKIAELRRGNTVGADYASASVPSDYFVEDGDLVFSWSGSLEVKFWYGGRAVLNQHLFKVTSERFPLWLCFQWILSHLEDFRHIAEGKATTMGHIQRHHLDEALVAIPPSALVAECDRVIAPLLALVKFDEVQSRALAAIRDTLLPKLLSGEIRVPLDDGNG